MWYSSLTRVSCWLSLLLTTYYLLLTTYYLLLTTYYLLLTAYPCELLAQRVVVSGGCALHLGVRVVGDR